MGIKRIRKVTAGRISFLHVLTGQTGMTGKKDINEILTSRQFCFKIRGRSGRINNIASRQFPEFPAYRGKKSVHRVSAFKFDIATSCALQFAEVNYG